MNRNAEYEALLSELEAPPELDGTVERAWARQRRSRRKRCVFGIPAASLAACFINAGPNNIFLTLCLCIIVCVIRYRERKNFSFALTHNSNRLFCLWLQYIVEKTRCQ